MIKAILRFFATIMFMAMIGLWCIVTIGLMLYGLSALLMFCLLPAGLAILIYLQSEVMKGLK